jgi:phosphoribosylanthranilate isomerase
MSTSSDLRSPVAIKFCGITNALDALEAIRCGAHALGFNGFTGSKRFIQFHEHATWIRALPPFTVRVAVLVNPGEEEIRQVLDLHCFDRVQLHGDESPEYCRELQSRGLSLIKALPLGNEASLEEIGRYSVTDILLDAPAPGVYGGTGKMVDWTLAQQALIRFPERRFILAGGLTAGNVGNAVETLPIYAVDTASGIEVSGEPRRKDALRMRAFAEEVRRAQTTTAP